MTVSGIPAPRRPYPGVLDFRGQELAPRDSVDPPQGRSRDFRRTRNFQIPPKFGDIRGFRALRPGTGGRFEDSWRRGVRSGEPRSAPRRAASRGLAACGPWVLGVRKRPRDSPGRPARRFSELPETLGFPDVVRFWGPSGILVHAPWKEWLGRGFRASRDQRSAGPGPAGSRRDCPGF